MAACASIIMSVDSFIPFSGFVTYNCYGKWSSFIVPCMHLCTCIWHVNYLDLQDKYMYIVLVQCILKSVNWEVEFQCLIWCEGS